ncbi:MAG: GAF domain-containing protein, partial [Actinomycetia bacterium]|nr:GAF domain-containing protein [Actinomycetes bacterium]
SKDFSSELEKLYKIKINSIYVIPLEVNEQIIGVLEIMNSFDKHKLDEFDFDLLSLLADQISAVLSKAIEYEESRLISKELSTLYELSSAASSTLDMQHPLTLILEMTKRAFKCEAGLINLLNIEDMPSLFNWGIDINIIKNIIHKSGANLIDFTLDKKETIIINDFDRENSEFGFKRGNIKKVMIKSLIVAPIISNSGKIGIFIIANKSINGKLQNFEKSDLRLFSAILNQISISIDNAIYYNKTIRLKIFNDNVINSLNSAVITTTMDGIITMKSHKAEKIFASTIKVLKTHITDLNLIDPDKKLNEVFEKKLTLHNYNLNYKLSKNMRVFRISNSILRDLTSKEIGMVFVIDDITEQMILKRQIERA